MESEITKQMIQGLNGFIILGSQNDQIIVEAMSIKSDRWIKQKANEEGMIEPFEPDQVRFLNNKKVISYGTSSYGYDVRCASEF